MWNAPPANRTLARLPSTRANADDGSTPDPGSEAATAIPLFASTRRIRGGVTSLIHQRKVNGPAWAAVWVSNTMSYTPGAGSTAPATGTVLPYALRYGLRSLGSPA